MRFLATLPGVALGPSPLSGTDAEARAYELRESFSPEAQQFVGGDISLGGLLLFLLVVLVIIWIAKEI